MKWLFFYMIFDVSAGGLQPKMTLRKTFASEQQCNTLGQEVAKEFSYEDNSLKSFSICIPESAFREQEMQVQRLDQ